MDGTMILKFILEKLDIKMQTGFISDFRLNAILGFHLAADRIRWQTSERLIL
jgi:hypothetical protein